MSNSSSPAPASRRERLLARGADLFSRAGLSSLATLVGLGLLYLLVVCLRVQFGFASPHYEPDDWAPFYPAEAALQYRWASRIANGTPVPAVDVRAQFPEGLRMWADIMPLMEWVAAVSYRAAVLPLLGKVTFREFSVWFVAVVSALPLLVAYGMGRLLTGRSLGGWVAVLLLASHPLGVERVVRNFGRENFALTFVFLPLLGLGAAWRAASADPLPKPARSKLLLWLGLSLAVTAEVIALASWHLSRTFLDIAILVIVLLALARQFDLSERRVAACWILLLSPACVLIPALRERGYLLSPGMLLGLGFALYTFGVSQVRRRWSLFAPVAICGGVAAWLRPGERDSHVGEVIWAKIQHLLQKPPDPAELSAEARLMWIEAFHSPTLAQWITFIALPALLAVAAMGIEGRRFARVWRERAGIRLLAALVTVWGVAFLFVYRMHVVLIFGLAVLAGVLVAQMRRGGGRRALFAALSAVLLFQTWQTWTFFTGNAWTRALQEWRPPPREPFVNQRRDTVDLLRWIRENSGPDDVFAGWFGVSSLVYAYADRPVIVQSKFENPVIRGKVLQLAAAYLGSEREMAAFCERYGASYVIYEAPFVLSSSTESLRYVAGYRTIPPDSTVYKMHFRPLKLEKFELVYQNGGFRVFEYLRSPTQRYRNLPLGWEAVFESEYYRLAENQPYDDAQTPNVMRAVQRLESTRGAAEALAGAGQYRDARKLLEQLLKKEPRYWRGWLSLARLAQASHDFPTMRRAAEGVFQGNPGHPEARRMTEEATQALRKNRSG